MPTKRQLLDTLRAFPLPDKVNSLDGISFRLWLVGMIASSGSMRTPEGIVSLADRIIELLSEE